MPEEPVSLHAPHSPASAHQSPSMELAPTEPAATVPADEVRASSSESGSSSTDLSDPQSPAGSSDADSQAPSPCKYLLNQVSEVLHVAVRQREAIPRRTFEDDGEFWSTACGVQLTLGKDCYELLGICPAAALPCRRPACLAALGLREPPSGRTASDDAAVASGED